MAHNALRSRTLPRTATALVTSGSVLALGAGAGALAAALLAAPAGAATFTVLNNNDNGAGSLRQAIIDANAAAGNDTIDFAPGLTDSIVLASDLPTITDGLTITGPGTSALTITGVHAFHIFDIATLGSSDVVISGLTLEGSVGLVDGTGDIVGGAIRSVDTPLTLEDVQILNSAATSNSSDSMGGAVFVQNAPGTGNVSIRSSVFARNVATATNTGDKGGGGGLWIQADNISLEGSALFDNEADAGGGAYLFATGQLTIDDSLIEENHAHFYTGGLLAGAGAVLLTDSVISGNVSDNAIGGIYVGAATPTMSGTARLQVSNTRISDNTATQLGGGLLFNLDGTSYVDRATITGNSGTQLGGLDVFGPMEMTSSTISNNSGIGINVGYGFGPVSNSVCSTSTGALQPESPGPRPPDQVTISNTTVSGNSGEGITVDAPYLSTGSVAVAPGAFAPARQLSPAACGTPSLSATLTLKHVLAADNVGTDVNGPSFSLFSLIETPSPEVFPGYGTIFGADPELLPLQQISDTVSVVPIPIGSTAWNAGWPDFTPPPSTDQRGLPRVVDIIDIGAYEIQEPGLAPRFTG